MYVLYTGMYLRVYVHVCSVQTTATVWASHHKIKDKKREMNMVYHNLSTLSTLSNQETSTRLFTITVKLQTL